MRARAYARHAACVLVLISSTLRTGSGVSSGSQQGWVIWSGSTASIAVLHATQTSSGFTGPSLLL